jgi:hypothetical protein
MVHSSTLIDSTDGEHLTYGGFNLGKTIHFGSLEFIADCFGSLSLSPKGNNSGVAFVGMAHSGSPSPCTILEDFANEFYTTSSIMGSSSFPISQRRSMVTLSIFIMTTPRLEDSSTPHTIVMVLPRTIVPCLNVGFPPERQQAYQEE